MSTAATASFDVPEYRPERIKRRIHQFLILLFACAMLGCVAMVAGPAINDYKISSDPGRALARVTDVSSTRTIVEFQDHEGRYQAPPHGIMYPTGLGEGQRVWVAFAKGDTNVVKVEGRNWTLAIIPALSVAAVSSAIFGLLWILVNFFTTRYIRRKEALTDPVAGPRRVKVTRIAPRTKPANDQGDSE